MRGAVPQAVPPPVHSRRTDFQMRNTPTLVMSVLVAFWAPGCAWDPLSVYADAGSESVPDDKADAGSLDEADDADVQEPDSAPSDGDTWESPETDAESDVPSSSVCTFPNDLGTEDILAIWKGLNCKECYQDGFDETCVALCLEGSIPLSQTCTSCVIELARCGRVECTEACGTVFGMTGRDCQQCIADRCSSPFLQCAQAPAPTCLCGPNSCSTASCGTHCGVCETGQICSTEGQCVCEPKCDGKSCGPDGCGSTCGSCTDSHCIFGACVALEDATCIDVIKCRSSCSDQTCADECLKAGSAQVQTNFSGVETCILEKGCGNSYTCAILQCIEPLGVCAVQNPGTATCVETSDCVQGCSQGDPPAPTCGTDCMATGNTTAQAIYIALEECLFCSQSSANCWETVTEEECYELGALCE